MALGYEPVVPPLRTRVEPPRTRGGGILACARAIALRLRGDARPITAAARLASSVSANTAPVCCDCFIGRVPRWDSPWVRCKGTGNYTKCTFTCKKYQRIFCYFHVSAMISVVHRPGLRRPSLRRATRARTGANRARHRAPRRRPDDDAPPHSTRGGCRLAQECDGWLTVGVTPAACLRARDRARRVPARGCAERRRDGARRGDRAHYPRRAQHHHAGQRNADPRRGRRRRVGGGHHAGPRPASGAGAHARRVPRHGQPRAARAPDLHQGLDRRGARRRAPHGADRPAARTAARHGRPPARRAGAESQGYRFARLAICSRVLIRAWNGSASSGSKPSSNMRA